MLLIMLIGLLEAGEPKLNVEVFKFTGPREMPDFYVTIESYTVLACRPTFEFDFFDEYKRTVWECPADNKGE